MPTFEDLSVLTERIGDYALVEKSDRNFQVPDIEE
jgi:hypothetical protein